MIVALKAQRVLLGISQKELGERIGVTQQMISYMESGLTPDPEIGTLARYADGVGLGIALVVKRSGPIPRGRMKKVASEGSV